MKRTDEDKQKALDDVKHADFLYHLATKPVTSPHRYTLDEIEALRTFGALKCANAPHLLSLVADYLPSGRDEQAMIGGYVVFMLMNKVPGQPLDYDTFWEKDEETREEIRQAFKVARM